MIANTVPSILTSPVQIVTACGIISHEEYKCSDMLNSSNNDEPSVPALGFVVFTPLAFLLSGPLLSTGELSRQKNS